MSLLTDFTPDPACDLDPPPDGGPPPTPPRRGQTDRRPPMNWNTTTMTAMTSSRWTNPPAVYELTMPSAHSTRRITAIVQSMVASLSVPGCVAEPLINAPDS